MSDEEGFLETIDYLASGKNKRAIHFGDAIEAIKLDDPRFDFTKQIAVPLQEAEHFEKLVWPARKRIDVMIMGNHEEKLWRFGNLTSLMCKHLATHNHKPEYGTSSCVIEVYRKKEPKQLMYRLYAAHKVAKTLYSNAKDWEQQQGNMKAKLKLELAKMAGDTLVMCQGHVHKLLVVPPSDRLYLYHENMRIKQGYLTQGRNECYINPDQRWYASVGSCTKLYTDKMGRDGEYVSGYAEKAGYGPTDLGFVIAKAVDGQFAELTEEKLSTSVKFKKNKAA